jgi:hypothetical protein
VCADTATAKRKCAELTHEQRAAAADEYDVAIADCMRKRLRFIGISDSAPNVRLLSNLAFEICA